MTFVKYMFSPNYARYEGVRPINIYLLRFLYFLMFALMGSDALQMLMNLGGQPDRFRGVAICVWVSYAALSFFGLINPLRWLPVVLFMISYKTLWLVFVAYPLWKAGTLAGSPVEEMAYVFLAAPFMTIIVPWKYVFDKYVKWHGQQDVQQPDKRTLSFSEAQK